MQSRRLLPLCALLVLLLAPLCVSSIPDGWEETEKAPAASESMAISLSLRIRARKQLEEAFWAISTPGSPRYTKHLSLEQLTELTAASPDVLSRITRWASSAGLRATIARTGDIVRIDGTVEQMSNLLSTRIARFRHVATGKTVLRAAESWTMPEQIAQSVAMVDGLHRFPRGRWETRGSATSWQHDSDDVDASTAPPVSRIVSGDQQVMAVMYPSCKDGSVPRDSDSAAVCASSVAISGVRMTFSFRGQADVQVTIAADGSGDGGRWSCGLSGRANRTYCLAATPVMPLVPNFVALSITTTLLFADGSAGDSHAYPLPVYMTRFASRRLLHDLYGVPRDLRVRHASTKQAVAEFLGEYYSEADLGTWLATSGLPADHFETVYGPNNASLPGGEATLDVQYLLGMAPGARNSYQSFAGGNEIKEPYLDWLHYLNELPSYDIPNVISISYGDLEANYTMEETSRINVEFMKAGMRGVSLLFSAGDDGVASFLGRANRYGDSMCKPFNPEYPASSPYVTAVGGTQLSTQHSPICTTEWEMGLDFRCHDVGEIACSAATGAIITTGGGFSSFHNRSDEARYQEAAVAAYFDSVPADKLPPADYFNAAGRAYPDISTLAHSYPIFIGGRWAVEDGTSASAPVMAGIVTLLNDARASAQLAPLGFLNPWLYHVGDKHPEAFTDIVLGDTSCTVPAYPNPGTCCEHFFSAQPGWDPVTGLGTPNFPVLVRLATETTASDDGGDGGDGGDSSGEQGGEGAVSAAASPSGSSSLLLVLVVLLIVAVAALAIMVNNLKNTVAEMRSEGRSDRAPLVEMVDRA